MLYLDLVNAEELTLYWFTLTISKDFLSGSFTTFDAQGRILRARLRELPPLATEGLR